MLPELLPVDPWSSLRPESFFSLPPLEAARSFSSPDEAGDTSSRWSDGLEVEPPRERVSLEEVDEVIEAYRW